MPGLWVGVGFHTDAMSPLWKAATTYGLNDYPRRRAGSTSGKKPVSSPINGR